MKIYRLILLFVFVLIPGLSKAYTQLGVRLSPGLSYSRLLYSGKSLNFSTPGLVFTPQVGVLYDYMFREHYYVSSGLGFFSTKMNYQYGNENKVSYTLQMLQIPIALKLYTSELVLDTRGFVEIGGAVNIKFSDTLSSDDKYITKISPLTLSVLLSVGVEHDTSLSTSVFASISYKFGLTSIVDTKDWKKKVDNKKARSCMDVVCIDVGIKF